MTNPSNCLNSLEIRRNMLKIEINSTSGNSIFRYIEEMYKIKIRSLRIGTMWSILQEH
jgi:hypothetical protein